MAAHVEHVIQAEEPRIAPSAQSHGTHEVTPDSLYVDAHLFFEGRQYQK